MRRRPASVIVAVGLFVIGGCSDDDGDQGDEASQEATQEEAFAAAIQAEHGLWPVVNDNGDGLDGIEVVSISRTADEPVGLWWLAARADAPEQPLVVFEMIPASNFQPERDQQLSDGRWVQIDGEGDQASVLIAGPDGGSIRASGPRLGPDELIAVVDGTAFGSTTVDTLADGWVPAGRTVIPTSVDGYSVEYELDDGTSFGTTIEPTDPAREALARFAPTSPVDLGTDRWAYRYDPSTGASGVVFEYDDDTVIDLRGDLTDDEIVAFIAGLRPIEVGEYEIEGPLPF